MARSSPAAAPSTTFGGPAPPRTAQGRMRLILAHPMSDDLLAAAAAARMQAHAPYSRFWVGAALRTASGRIFAGCNVENASYPVGTCAETGAIAAMVVAGERQIVEVLVMGESEAPLTPCGACRQRLAEFGGPDVPVHAAGRDGIRATHALGELLPFAFDLGKT